MLQLCTEVILNRLYLQILSWGSSVSMVTTLRVRSPAGSIVSRPALGLTQPPIQGVSEVLSLG
jgi:hypothetical protein